MGVIRACGGNTFILYSLLDCFLSPQNNLNYRFRTGPIIQIANWICVLTYMSLNRMTFGDMILTNSRPLVADHMSVVSIPAMS